MAAQAKDPRGSKGPGAAPRPLRWRSTVQQRRVELQPFRGYFEEFAAAQAAMENAKESTMKSHEDGAERARGSSGMVVVSQACSSVEVNMPELRLVTVTGGVWGRDNDLIEDWFAEGDTLADTPVEAPEVEPMERAFHWMRSLASATGLRSS